MPLLSAKTPFETTRLDKCIEIWHTFCRDLLPESSVALVYHGDADGAVAASVIELVLSRGLSLPPVLYWVGTDEYDFKELRRWLFQLQPTHIVFLDIAIENEPNVLEGIIADTGSGIFIFDHHLVRHRSNLNSALLANPTPEPLKPSEVPVPSFAFALALSRDAKLFFPKWLLIYAIFAEGVDSFVEPFLRTLVSSMFQLQPNQALREWYRSSSLGRLGSLVRASFSEKFKNQVFVKLLQTSIREQHNSCNELLRALETHFGPAADRISFSISKLVSKYEESISQATNRLIVIEVDDVHAVAGPVASILRSKAPEKVVLAWLRKNDLVICELRTGFQSGTNLVNVLKELSQEVPLTNFGGHASAAGASFSDTEIERFLVTIRSIIEK